MFSGLVWETINGVIYCKIPSPDSSGKPMPVENHFFLVVAERPKEAIASDLKKGLKLNSLQRKAGIASEHYEQKNSPTIYVIGEFY